MGRGHSHPPILGRRALREDIKALLRKSAGPEGERRKRGGDGAPLRSKPGEPTSSPGATDPKEELQQERPSTG